MILSRSFPLRALLIALLPLVLSAACDKLPRNGALDGQWQLVRRNNADVTAQRIYWAVQLDLIQLRSPRVAPTTSVSYSGGVILRFVRRADSLLVETGFLMDRDHGRDLHIGPRRSFGARRRHVARAFRHSPPLFLPLGAHPRQSSAGVSQMVNLSVIFSHARVSVGFHFFPSPPPASQSVSAPYG